MVQIYEKRRRFLRFQGKKVSFMKYFRTFASLPHLDTDGAAKAH
jgi:hypothetical protein